ncbi:hypothetical protein WDW37_17200 [Bdellovibrionota bacterium FG-1]
MTKNAIIPLDAIGPIVIPVALFIECDKCGATYVPEGFQEAIEKHIAIFLILDKRKLTREQIRFLRLVSNKTQEEVAKAVGAADKSAYCRFESTKDYGLDMSENMQIRLRLFYADHFGLTDLKAIVGMYRISSEETVKIEARKIFSEENKKELEATVHRLEKEEKKSLKLAK